MIFKLATSTITRRAFSLAVSFNNSFLWLQFLCSVFGYVKKSQYFPARACTFLIVIEVCPLKTNYLYIGIDDIWLSNCLMVKCFDSSQTNTFFRGIKIPNSFFRRIDNRILSFLNLILINQGGGGGAFFKSRKSQKLILFIFFCVLCARLTSNRRGSEVFAHMYT